MISSLSPPKLCEIFSSLFILRPDAYTVSSQLCYLRLRPSTPSNVSAALCNTSWVHWAFASARRQLPMVRVVADVVVVVVVAISPSRDATRQLIRLINETMPELQIARARSSRIRSEQYCYCSPYFAVHSFPKFNGFELGTIHCAIVDFSEKFHLLSFFFLNTFVASPNCVSWKLKIYLS